MEAATEGRKRGNRASLKAAIGWVCLALAYVIALSFYKTALLDDFARQSLESLKPRHPKIVNLFQPVFTSSMRINSSPESVRTCCRLRVCQESKGWRS